MKTAMATFAPLSLKNYYFEWLIFTIQNDKRTTARHPRMDVGQQNHLVHRVYG
jgi:hypothetical protein